MAYENPHMYNEPHAAPSSVGAQIYIEYYQKKALVEAAKEQYFGQLSDVSNMPKHFGKTIKMFHYMPILDDRNINDQGIDANGMSLATQTGLWEDGVSYAKHTIEAVDPDTGLKYYVEGMASGADLAAAKTAAANKAQGNFLGWAHTLGFVVALQITYADVKTAMEAAGWVITLIQDADDKFVNYGNLYGSSKDVGTIVGKIPALSETGGRVNRVGMTRLMVEGSINKFGFFDEYTQESLDFDNDAELEGHITGESVKAANEMTEDQLQIDLLNGAGVIRYTGTATSTGTLKGGDGAAGNEGDSVTYDDFVKLAIELDNNRCPKNTKVITGSRMIDTRVVNSARYMYIGSELLPSIMKMVDYHGNQAFIPIAQYGAAATIARGEVGAVHDFRIIVVPEMMHWDAAGANAPAGTGAIEDDLFRYSQDGAGQAKYNVYPMLVVGDGSFTHIGFQTDGKNVKFKITHKKPGTEVADRQDPYGEVGFYSIKWYYGVVIQRPERLALMKTVAEM